LGTLFKKTGRLKEAEQAYASALALFKQLAADDPTRPESRQELALSHDNMGGLLRDIGRLKEAAEAHAAGIAIQKQLVAEYPNRPEFRQELAIGYINLGRLLWITGPLNEAEAAFAAALALQKQLAADFPTRPEFRVELADSQNNLGVLCWKTGRLPEAEAALRAAIDLRRQLAADFLARPHIRQRLAGSYGNLGGVFEDTGRLKEAEEAYIAALALSRQLAADFPNQPDMRNGLASALGNLALYHLKRRDFQAAKAKIEEALPHQEAVLKANPGNPTYRQFYVNRLTALVQTSAGLGDSAAAKQAARRLSDLGWDPPANAYDAACALSLCIPIVQENEKTRQQERDKQAKFYGDQAMDMFREAVARGFENAAHMKQDKDLNPLRGREDFKTLLANLEANKQ
jgi:tetratricopeptide (TPR) repeat protein